MEKRYENQKQYWEDAGKVGYHKTVFASEKVGDHATKRIWREAINIARYLGMNEHSSILELGCGDGKFAEEVLAEHFKKIDAIDFSEAAIERARQMTRTDKVKYYAKDIIHYEYDENDQFDGAFLMWILHHVKDYTPEVVARLARVCRNVVVVEPNGNNLIRKGLELLPSYKKAGERSFRIKELARIFEAAGYSVNAFRRIHFIPNLLPEIFFEPFKKLEAIIESNRILDRLCSTYIIGFELKK
jgi:2-polyprenyl-3-methyl-5-hydroxy-6-metoxy-1,4-benzoquinol methylase